MVQQDGVDISGLAETLDEEFGEGEDTAEALREVMGALKRRLLSHSPTEDGAAQATFRALGRAMMFLRAAPMQDGATGVAVGLSIRAAALEWLSKRARPRSGVAGEELAVKAMAKASFGARVGGGLNRIRYVGRAEGYLWFALRPARGEKSLEELRPMLLDLCLEVFPGIAGIVLMERPPKARLEADTPYRASVRRTVELVGRLEGFDVRTAKGTIVGTALGRALEISGELFARLGVQAVLPGSAIALAASGAGTSFEIVGVRWIDESAARVPWSEETLPDGVEEIDEEWRTAEILRYDPATGAGEVQMLRGPLEALPFSADALNRSGVVALNEDMPVMVQFGRTGSEWVGVYLRPVAESCGGIKLRAGRRRATLKEILGDARQAAEAKIACSKARSKKGNGRGREVTLADLAGMDDARAWGEALAHDLAAFQAGEIAWSEVDPGAVVHGPPGTGKTTFVKALAASCGVPLVATSYAEWQRTREGHAGDVTKAMHASFEEARKHGVAILFIDELDTMPTRHAAGAHNRQWWTEMVNALLEEIDSLASSDGVVVIGACNDPRNLDPALVRPGRLDGMIRIGLPDAAALAQILRFHLGADGERLAGLPELGLMCVGLAGAGVAKLVREARRLARGAKRPLAREDVVAALTKGSAQHDARHAWRVAVHECGHALSALLLGVATEVSVSAIARGTEGGRTVTKDAFNDGTRPAFEHRLVTLLAGRAAEEVLLGEISAGAGGGADSDLAAATRLATEMVATFGLGDTHSLLWDGAIGREIPLVHDPLIREEVSRILYRGYEQAVALLLRHRVSLTRLAEALLARKVLGHAEIVALVEELSCSDHPDLVSLMDQQTTLQGQPTLH